MQIPSFEKWLKSIKKYGKGTVNSRISNCKRIEEFYGDLDEHYKNDKLKYLKVELNSDKHKIPINGDYYTGTATLKSALKLYLEFKDNDLLDSIMNSPDLDPDKHDGSYELVKETLESISKVELSNIGIEDLDMLYGMSLGSWRLGIDPRNTRIENSHVSNEEKKRLKSMLSRIVEKAEKKEYENVVGEDWSIGMFGTGFLSFNGKSTDEDAKNFLSLLIKTKDLSGEEKIFDILEEGFKNGISGIQAGSASMMLHCLKPRMFPILNGAVAESIIILEGTGVVLNKANQLTHYIKNTRIIKAFRDEFCKFKNYRVLDIKLWDTKVLVDNGDDNLNLSEERLKSIIDAFKSIGGQGKLGDVFDIIKNDSRFHYERFSNKSSAEGSIRLIIQEHSSDTEIYKDSNKDLFFSIDGIGKGNWGLRNIKKSLNLDFSQPLNFDNLYFSNSEVLKFQISIALKSGKSIILIGPPGTGKSKLAKKIAESYKVDSKMVTAMSDWSSYDTIGGYKPNVDGSLYFEEGIFLSSFKSKDGRNKNKWLIIDEINRADIDKSFGPFFRPYHQMM